MDHFLCVLSTPATTYIVTVEMCDTNSVGVDIVIHGSALTGLVLSFWYNS